MADPKTTHTYPVLPISKAAYDEIKNALRQVGHEPTVRDTIRFGEIMDMDGIWLSAKREYAKSKW